MAWWGVLGLGLGLIVLSALVWMRQASGEGRSVALQRDLQRLEPVVSKLRAGQAPTPEMVRDTDRSALAPLMQAMVDASRQRRQALMAYQAQIESAGLGSALTPANLALPSGRVSVRQSLAQLQGALDALSQQDAAVQSRLDDAVRQWLGDAPQWGDAAKRQALVTASAGTSRTMAEFFKVERDIVAQVESLLSYLDKIGPGVGLEGTGAQQELVFSKAADLAFYRSALMQLGYLGRHEQELLVQAQQASGAHAKQVGELLVTSSTAMAR